MNEREITQEYKIGQRIIITSTIFAGNRGTVWSKGKRGYVVSTDGGLVLDLRVEELSLEEPERPESYWQTSEGQLNQAIREGLREAGVSAPFHVFVGPILRAVQGVLDSQHDDIDYKHDWAGEVRTDPEDGNSYVLRKVGHEAGQPGYGVIVNDIMGGHTRTLRLDYWLGWQVVSTD